MTNYIIRNELGEEIGTLTDALAVSLIHEHMTIDVRVNGRKIVDPGDPNLHQIAGEFIGAHDLETGSYEGYNPFVAMLCNAATIAERAGDNIAASLYRDQLISNYKATKED